MWIGVQPFYEFEVPWRVGHHEIAPTATGSPQCRYRHRPALFAVVTILRCGPGHVAARIPAQGRGIRGGADKPIRHHPLTGGGKFAGTRTTEQHGGAELWHGNDRGPTHDLPQCARVLDIAHRMRCHSVDRTTQPGVPQRPMINIDEDRRCLSRTSTGARNRCGHRFRHRPVGAVTAVSRLAAIARSRCGPTRPGVAPEVAAAAASSQSETTSARNPVPQIRCKLPVPIGEHRTQHCGRHPGLNPVHDPSVSGVHLLEFMNMPPRQHSGRGHGRQASSGDPVDEPVRRVVSTGLVPGHQRKRAGKPSTARPSASESASSSNDTGCHGGASRANAPGRANHANTSDRGTATTAEHSMLIPRPYARAAAIRSHRTQSIVCQDVDDGPGHRGVPESASNSTNCSTNRRTACFCWATVVRRARFRAQAGRYRAPPVAPGVAGSLRGGDGTCGALIDIGEVVAGQLMHQVVEDPLAGDRRTHVVVDGEVCAHHLHPFALRDLGQLRRGPSHHPRPVPGAEQFRDQPPAVARTSDFRDIRRGLATRPGIGVQPTDQVFGCHCAARATRRVILIERLDEHAGSNWLTGPEASVSVRSHVRCAL